jgi:hypothetical protein
MSILLLSATLLLAAPPELRLLSDFEQPGPLTLVGEGLQPGSRVSLSTDQAHGGTHAARLDYQFVEQVKGLQYAGFHADLTFAEVPGKVLVWVYGDGLGETLRLRLLTKSGECHQFTLGAVAFKGWRQMVAKIGRGGECWGGDGSGKLAPPIRFDSLLLDSAVRPAQGTVFFDDIRYTVAAPAAADDLVRAPSRAADAVQVKFTAPTVVEPGTRLDVSLQLTDHRAAPAPIPLTFTVFGPDGAVVSQPPALTAEAGHGAGFGLDPFKPSLTQPFGLYRVRAEWQVADDHNRSETTFAVLPPMPETDVGTNPFGACLHFEQHKGKLPLTYQLLKRIGGRWARDELGWGGVERAKGVFTFEPRADAYVKGAGAAGLREFPIFDYANGLYDKGASPASPEAQAAFAEYARQLVLRYKDTVHDWEVFNEPNGGFWKPKPDPVAYARLLKVTYAAVKSADPTATVVAAATAGVDLGFIDKMLAAGGTTFDALSIHPYNYPSTPEAGGLVSGVRRVRAVLARHGCGDKPIWITEIGWPNHATAGGATEEDTANALVRSLSLFRSEPLTGPYMWYDFQNDGLNAAYNEDNFGLIRLDGSPKRPYVAAAMFNRVTAGKRFAKDLSPGEPVYVHVYEGADGERTAVVWATPFEASVELRLDCAQVEWSDATGVLKTVPVTGGKLTVPAGEGPVFITGRFALPAVTVKE